MPQEGAQRRPPVLDLEHHQPVFGHVRLHLGDMPFESFGHLRAFAGLPADLTLNSRI